MGGEAGPRQARTLEEAGQEWRAPVRWARSTTERSAQPRTAPAQPNPQHFPKSGQAFLLPFGRKISRDSAQPRKVGYQKQPKYSISFSSWIVFQASTLADIKPSNIRKRNFGATFADAVQKENAQKISDANGVPSPVVKFQGGKSTQPWNDADNNNKRDDKEEDNSDIKGERTRGAIVRGTAKLSDKDWERLRVGVKRAKPEWSSGGAAGSSPGPGNEGPPERRGRIRIKSSFLGIYQNRQSTTRSPRTEDDIPQRPLKRDRIRNLRIRRPFISNINSNNTSTDSPILRKTTTLSTTTLGSPTPRAEEINNTDTVKNLKGIFMEYKEIVRTTPGPVSQTTRVIQKVSSISRTMTTTATTTTTKTTTTTTTTFTTITTPVISTTTTVEETKLPKSSTVRSVVSSTSQSFDGFPNVDSSENTITTVSESSTKSLKQSIQSPASSTTASFTVTESKESPGSEIKQSKIQQRPSLFQFDITTRNPVEIQRPREELQKDLLEAIRRKISRNKASNANTPSYSQSTNLLSSTKPPFFRPISFGPRKNDDTQSLPNVKIFVNIPDKKRGPDVKIPNVSHIQDKLERLNDAIKEGLKLDRLREQEEKAILNEMQEVSDGSDEKSRKNDAETASSSNTGKLEESSDLITKTLEETLRKQSTSKPVVRVAPRLRATVATVRPTTTTTLTASTTDTPKPASKLPKHKKRPKLFSEHPSSHFRPDNWTSSDFIPMPKSNLPPKEDVRLFVATPKPGMYTPIADGGNNTDNNGTGLGSPARATDNESKVLEDITGTTVYVIGVIAIIPAVGLLAWVVRMVLRRKVT